MMRLVERKTSQSKWSETLTRAQGLPAGGHFGSRQPVNQPTIQNRFRNEVNPGPTGQRHQIGVIQRPRIVSFIKLHRIRFFIQRESLPLSECDIAKVTSGSVAEVTHRSAEEVAHFFPTGVTSAIRMRYCQSNF